MLTPGTRALMGARSAFILAAFTCAAAPLFAQRAPDTTRVTYRTREVLFVAAGRAERLAVGDTLFVTTAAGTAVAAVVVSVAQHTASARLLAAADLPESARAVWMPRAEALGDAPPPAAAPIAPGGPEPAAPAAPPASPARRPLRGPRQPRLVGTFQVEQLGSSGGSSRLSTSQTIGMASIRAVAAPGVEVRLRTTSRRRGGSSAALAGGNDLETVIYQAEVALGGRASRWQASLGRFIPQGAMALGYLDGLRVEWRPAGDHAVGVVAGFVPQAVRLRASGETRRLGAYWRFGQRGPLSGSLATAADWSGGARRRTQLASQGLWAPGGGLSFSWYADADLGAPWDSGGARLTNLYGGTRVRLPAGFRASLGVESHQAVRLWESFITGDTLPLPGRLTGYTFSLGRSLAGFAVDAGGARLSRSGDPSATTRATFTASRRALFLAANWQHGDLLDYGSFMARVVLPRRLPVTASLGLLAATTRPSGGTGLWRYSLRPELSGALQRSWYWSLGGDIGRYAGRSTTWLHAGVSYRFER